MASVFIPCFNRKGLPLFLREQPKEGWGSTEVGDNTAGILPVWQGSEWAALRPKFFIFLGQIHPRFCPRHEQSCGLGLSLLVTWFLMVCPLISSESVAVLAQGQKCLRKEEQEVEIRVDVPGSDCLGREWHLAFVFGHY